MACLPRQCQDRLVLLAGSSARDLRGPPFDAGICAGKFSIAHFVGEQTEEGRRKREKAGQLSGPCLLAVPNLCFLGPQAVCVGGARWWLGWPSAPAASPGDGSSVGSALSMQWWRPAGQTSSLSG